MNLLALCNVQNYDVQDKCHSLLPSATFSDVLDDCVLVVESKCHPICSGFFMERDTVSFCKISLSSPPPLLFSPAVDQKVKRLVLICIKNLISFCKYTIRNKLILWELVLNSFQIIFFSIILCVLKDVQPKGWLIFCFFFSSADPLANVTQAFREYLLEKSLFTLLSPRDPFG